MAPVRAGGSQLLRWWPGRQGGHSIPLVLGVRSCAGSSPAEGNLCFPSSKNVKNQSPNTLPPWTDILRICQKHSKKHNAINTDRKGKNIVFQSWILGRFNKKDLLRITVWYYGCCGGSHISLPPILAGWTRLNPILLELQGWGYFSEELISHDGP